MAAPFTQIVALDFETRWSSKDYTLSKMTTEEYVRSPNFKDFGACIQRLDADLDGPAIQWYKGGAELRRVLDTFDWSKTALLAHNAQFDVAIVSWHYGIQPAFIFDTLSMARALRGIEVGNSLMKLSEEFGLPPKGKAVHSTDGLVELTPEIEHELAEYCKHDVFLLVEIFKRLLPGFPKSELRLIDMTLRMYTRPLLQLDEDMLHHALHEERETREALLERLGVTDGVLASNDQFAEVLRSLGVEPPTKKKKPTVKTPNPVGTNYAFAKTDAMFQAMLNGENEDVALLCEARLKVKSTTERTRAQRFLEIAGRGALPVPLSYYGAATGRWTAAKGSAINMQNLKRGSFLRKAIMAPAGYEVIVADLSQIEPRVLGWLADYDDLLNIFRSGEDAYAMFGRQMFNMPTLNKKDNPDLRQSAKSALLGCFGPDTKVLTNRGWVPIVRVQATDTVWDGEEWACHQGVLPQGEKDVLTALGVSATSDHEILTEHGWETWSAVLANHSLLGSALSSASLPALGGVRRTGRTTQQCAAPAGGKASLIATTLRRVAARAAEIARTKQPSPRGMRSAGILTCAQTRRTETGSSTASAPSSCAAPTRAAQRILTTAGAALRSTLHGLRTALNSCATLLGSMVGMFPRYSLIAQTIAGGTSPATFGSYRAASTCRTSAASPCAKSKNSDDASTPLKQRMQTYDIAYAGPRNRYTILTDEGPLVVHNCGYGLGWASFASQLLVGFLGAPPVRYDKEFAKKLGVTSDYVNRFLDWDDNLQKMADIPHTCTTKELVIHCVAAKKIIDIYRATAYPVVGFWDLCSSLIQRSLADGQEYDHKGVLLFRKEEIVLANGMSLKYPNLRQQKDERGRPQWVYGPDATKLYAGKITNNVTQATARIVMTDGMIRIAKRFPVVGTVHDEVLALAATQDAAQGLAWMLDQMTMEPRYMPGIPLAAEGGHHQRYGMAKN